MEQPGLGATRRAKLICLALLSAPWLLTLIVVGLYSDPATHPLLQTPESYERANELRIAAPPPQFAQSLPYYAGIAEFAFAVILIVGMGGARVFAVITAGANVGLMLVVMLIALLALETWHM